MLKNLLRTTLAQTIVHKKDVITNYYTPSTRTQKITIEGGGKITKFIAPSNGYVVLYAMGGGGIVQNLKNELQMMLETSVEISVYQGYTVAAKGDQVSIMARGHGEAKFIYAEGSK